MFVNTQKFNQEKKIDGVYRFILYLANFHENIKQARMDPSFWRKALKTPFFDT